MKATNFDSMSIDELADWLVRSVCWRNYKVLNPLPGTKLRSQPAGLLAAATPCFGGLVWVPIFREDSRIWSSAGLF